MMGAAQAQGAELRMGRVTGIVRGAASARVTGVEVDGARIEADAVVIAMGPGSVLAPDGCLLPPAFGLKGHSIVFETGSQVPPEALFLDTRNRPRVAFARGRRPAPRWHDLGLCDLQREARFRSPRRRGARPGAIERLHHHAAGCRRHCQLQGASQPGLPPPRDPGQSAADQGDPGLAGAYVATGHSVWGILNAPATGEAMAELIADGAARTVDSGALQPGAPAAARSEPAAYRIEGPLAAS